MQTLRGSSTAENVPERLSRLFPLLGEGLAVLRSATVAVVGLGGVGSWAAEALARSGVGKLLLADPDVVRESDLNRQLFATLAETGEPKVDAAARRLAGIAPDAAVETRRMFVDGESVRELLACRPDVLVDAVDTLDAKAGMIAACLAAGVPVVSSMGAGRLLDPTGVRVADISHAFGCPLARALRRKLRSMEVRSGVRVVFSPAPRLPAPGGGSGPAFLGSAVWVTAVFGFTIAGECVRMLTETRV